MTELRGRTALITGANHGIGAATAELLASRGCRVVASYLRLVDEPDPGVPVAYRSARARDADWLVTRIADQGGEAFAVEADLTDAGAPARLFDAAEERSWPVDILVNNATGWLPDTFTPATTDHLGRTLRPVSAASVDRQFAVDARATALLIGEFARRHTARRATWGRIVSLTSGGPDGFPSEVSYGAAKAALENFTMSAAVELATYGIAAMAVQPPVTDTGWVTDDVRAFVDTSPRHVHVARPEEVAEVIAFLCTGAGALLTGNVVRLR